MRLSAKPVVFLLPVLAAFAAATTVLAVRAAAAAQTPPPASATASRATSRTLTAVLVARDEERKTVRLRPTDPGSEEITAAVDPECPYTRRGAPADLAAFVPGERVVARVSFLTAPRPMAILRELWDEGSYADEKRSRTELCVGKVASSSAGALAVKREGDGRVVTFRVTAKTRILKFDRSAPLEAFPIGAAVAVKPRGLPGGGVMAVIVAPTAAEVAAAHLDTLVRWEGLVEAVEPDGADGPVITLLRSDGARRRILLIPGASVKQGRRALTPAQIPPGAPVRIHLVKGQEKKGLRLADEVSLPASRPAAAAGAP
jgi:hypothetical protein